MSIILLIGARIYGHKRVDMKMPYLGTLLTSNRAWPPKPRLISKERAVSAIYISLGYLNVKLIPKVIKKRKRAELRAKKEHANKKRHPRDFRNLELQCDLPSFFPPSCFFLSLSLWDGKIIGMHGDDAVSFTRTILSSRFRHSRLINLSHGIIWVPHFHSQEKCFLALQLSFVGI